MKKRILACLAVLVAVMLTGCMRVSVGMDIKADGTTDISLLYAMSDELLNFDMDDEDFDDEDSDDEDSDDEDDVEDTEEDPTSLSEDQIKDLENRGWTYEKYAEDGFTGYVIKKAGVALNEVGNEFSGAEGSTGLGSDTFTLNETDGTYTLDWKVLGSEEASESAEYAEYFTQFNGYMKLVITLPEAPINSNATEVSEDGKTLTWDLLTMTDPNAHVEFKLPSSGGSSSIIFIVIAVVAIIAIILVIVLLARKSAAKNKVEDVPAQTENSENTENNENN